MMHRPGAARYIVCREDATLDRMRHQRLGAMGNDALTMIAEFGFLPRPERHPTRSGAYSPRSGGKSELDDSLDVGSGPGREVQGVQTTDLRLARLRSSTEIGGN